MTGPQVSSPAVSATAANAVFSPCGRYRYLLSRTWDPTRARVGFVLLNPSTAGHTVDDPTIRRCVGFGRGWGFGGLVVANLFALRATNPTVLLDTAAAGGDPIGPNNAAHLRSLATEHTVVLGWGAKAAVVDGADYPRRVADELVAADAAVFHLGLCRDGAPRHPLYLSRATPMSPWRAGS